MDKIERTRLLWVWYEMKYRCINPKNKAYPRYGGRGIYVCDEWIESFDKFIYDMGKRPKNASIERIDNNDGYRKDNCMWATSKEQNSNKRNCIYVFIDDNKMTLKDACRFFNIKYRPVHKRLYRGWNIKEALLTPIAKGNKHNARYGATKYRVALDAAWESYRQ